jgi:hypothetical protein
MERKQAILRYSRGFLEIPKVSLRSQRLNLEFDFRNVAKMSLGGWVPRFMLVNLASKEAEFWRIMVPG